VVELKTRKYKVKQIIREEKGFSKKSKWHVNRDSNVYYLYIKKKKKLSKEADGKRILKAIKMVWIITQRNMSQMARE
jgi:hypothetical protein